MTTATDTYLLLRAFVNELARCGLRDACTSPGSRSTPLVLSLASEPRLRCHSHIDERCSGFFALGLAKATGLPAAVACTSGTAAAELLPAVIEAHEAGVPLLILTADRPPELRENGAGQTIDQVKLFGQAAKWFFEVGTHKVTEKRLRWMRTLACRAYWRALEGQPGVVHLNFPLREPLVRDATPLPADGTGRPDGHPLVTCTPARAAAPEDTRSLAGPVAAARRGVVVAGRYERDTALGEAAAAFCAAAGWPLLADPLSGARRGEAAVAHYDALLRHDSFAASVKPDLVLRVGDLPTSKPLREWLAGMCDVPQAAIEQEGRWQDPDAALCRRFALEPAAALRALAQHALAQNAPTSDPDWLASWRSADERAAEALLGVLGASGLSEPTVAAELGVLLPKQATLFVASSMPVRDIESFWPVRADPPRVLCNRGANGIDGTVSSAFGAAAASDGGGGAGGSGAGGSGAGGSGAGGGPVILLIGDVALAHDIGGLLAARRLQLDLTIVLIDNGGGGIFDFLPVAAAPMARSEGSDSGSKLDAPGPARGATEAEAAVTGSDGREDLYTRHIATPTGLDFAQAAKLYGLEHETVADVLAFRAALERALTRRPRRAGIIEVRGDRAENVALHRRAWEAVAGVLAEPGMLAEREMLAGGDCSPGFGRTGDVSRRRVSGLGWGT
jgi:2-succinyl-5-enolpyruvyl-6-hydroxy-3-cyclohexene-1-carboxylate synthase